MTDPTTRVRAILDAATPGNYPKTMAGAITTVNRANKVSRNLLPAALDVVEAARAMPEYLVGEKSDALVHGPRSLRRQGGGGVGVNTEALFLWMLSMVVALLMVLGILVVIN